MPNGNPLHGLRVLSALLAFLITLLLLLSTPIFTHIRSTFSQPRIAHSVFNPHNHALNHLSPVSHHHRSHSHNHTYSRRAALSEPFQCLVNKGAEYWNQGVLPAFAGASRFPAPQFGGGGVDRLADSGWTSHEEAREVPRWWKDAFKAMKGKAPKGDGARFIYLDQSGDFENAFGEQVGCTGGAID
ncbi:MAG: hypothetical protein Q9208_007531 [Pyrenodesmia sp. 3 TL-2023]